MKTEITQSGRGLATQRERGEMSIKSSVVIAKLLSSEGFTDHVGNQVEKYWKQSVMRYQAKRKIARLEKDCALSGRVWPWGHLASGQRLGCLNGGSVCAK